MSNARKNKVWNATQAKDDIQAHQTRLSGQPASRMLGLKLSPFHSYSGLLFSSTEGGETYHRSDKHFLRQMEMEKKMGMYDDKKAELTYGKRAYVGAYKNNLQLLGDVAKPGAHVSVKSKSGNAKTFDMLLHAKHETCRYIVDSVGATTSIKVGFYNDYPCVMVLIRRQTIHAAYSVTKKKPSDGAMEEWVNFLVSYLSGIANAEAIKRGIPIEIVRRSSFGFLTPTVAPTAQSIRINVGLIPKEYADVLVYALKGLDQTLTGIANNTLTVPALVRNTFYGNADHKEYLAKKYETPALKDALQLLWQQVEKGGKTTVQNIMRTAYARDGIASAVYAEMRKPSGTLVSAIAAGVNWAAAKIKVVNGTLTFDQSADLSYTIANVANDFHSTDEAFWLVIKGLIASVEVENGGNTVVMSALSHIKAAAKFKTINHLYSKIEYLNELLFVRAIELAKDADVEDGYGSDSDTECTVKDKVIYTKKVVVSNGMRAIWASLLAVDSKNIRNTGVYLDPVYYEVNLGLWLIASWTKNLKAAESYSNATICVADLNACVTTGVQTAISVSDLDNEKAKNKYLVLDTTSATTEQVYRYISWYAASDAKALFLVSSGLKNEQLGADKNAYGTVRIFINDKQELDKLYASIKSNEIPVKSLVSHHYRRAMKAVGAVPTAAAYFAATQEQEDRPTAAKPRR